MNVQTFNTVSKNVLEEYSPSARDMQRAKRICRYLMGTRDWTLNLEPDREIDTLQMMVDSDWATDKVDRRSTSAGVAQLGGCTILTYSRTLGSPALSSAEAEGYALGSGACEGLFICAVAKELSVDLKLVVYSYSTSTISQHSKMGLGRMKHVELRFLFVKDLVKREKLSLCKVLGTDNPADLGTKVLDVATHRYLCHLVVLRPVNQVVEEVKGQGSQAEFAVLWKCWVAERAEKSENTLSRTGAMGTGKLDVDELARAENLMPMWCVLTRSRKAERACEITTSEQHLLDMSKSILNDRSVPAHAGFGESFEDQCGEGFHVNSC